MHLSFFFYKIIKDYLELKKETHKDRFRQKFVGLCAVTSNGHRYQAQLLPALHQLCHLFLSALAIEHLSSRMTASTQTCFEER